HSPWAAGQEFFTILPGSAIEIQVISSRFSRIISIRGVMRFHRSYTPLARFHRTTMGPDVEGPRASELGEGSSRLWAEPRTMLHSHLRTPCLYVRIHCRIWRLTHAPQARFESGSCTRQRPAKAGMIMDGLDILPNR